MRSKIVPFFVLALLLFCSSFNFGQDHEMIIEPYSVSGSFLQTAILGDTTTTGERNDPDRVYVLRRDGLYYQNAAIIVDGFDLRIKAEAGSGARPEVYLIQNDAGTFDSQLFDVRGNTIDLKNLALCNWDEDTSHLSIMQGFIINGSGAGNEIIVDSCVLKGGYSATIRINAASKQLRLTNSIVANSGNGLRSNLGNGRSIDFRATTVDSALIQNCTLINITDRAVRHYGTGQAPLRNFTFDHNTVVNDMATHGCLGLGLVDGYVKVTNSLFVDNFMFGNDTISYNRITEFSDPNERGPSGAYRMTMVGAVPNSDSASATYSINNNFYSVSPDLQTMWDAAGNVAPLIPLTWFINSQLGADSTNAFVKLDNNISFTDAPATPLNFVQWYFDPSKGARDKATPVFSHADDFDRQSLHYFNTAMNLQYSQSSPAFTGAENGLPAGDLNWWAGVVGVNDKSESALPTKFSLEQNYPNPFNPSTKIVYSVPKESQIKLEIFNILGQKVATLVNEVKPTGNYSINFDASSLSSGVYVYQLTSQNQILSKKMMLLK